MAAASVEGLAAAAPPREQFSRMWSNWMDWATSNPGKRRALALLSVSDDVAEEAHAASRLAMADIAVIVERARACGPMRDAPMDFVSALMNGLAEATMDYMISDPAHADGHCLDGFEALCRVLGC